MDIIFIPILNCISLILGFYQYVILFYIILGWLEHFKIINPYSNLVYSLHNILFSLAEPVLSEVRRLIPLRIGVDISPVVVIIGIHLIQDVLARIVVKIG